MKQLQKSNIITKTLYTYQKMQSYAKVMIFLSIGFMCSNNNVMPMKYILNLWLVDTVELLQIYVLGGMKASFKFCNLDFSGSHIEP